MESPIDEYPTLTVGAEFEFFIVWRWQRHDEELKLSGTAGIISGVIIVPRQDPTESTLMQGIWIRNCCYTEIWKLLVRHNVSVNPVPLTFDPSALSIPTDHAHPNAANTENPIYYRWSLSSDISLYPDDNDAELAANISKEYHALDVELISPALFDATDSYVEVESVVKIIKDNLLVIVPESAGYHVHVGMGKERFANRHLQKIAAALFMLDPIFSPLHPDTRDDNEYCWRNRLYSNLAQGMTAETASQEESENSAPKLGDPADEFNIVNGVSEILNTKSTGAVAKLMRTPNRGAYNFRSYNLSANGRFADEKPTIEFRQGAGTMNEVWAVCWARICVKTVDWARRASHDELLEWARKCQRAERDVRQYNAKTFVRDVLKLPDEATYIRAHSPTQRADPPADPESKQAIWRRQVSNSLAS
jgi:hypothetical protein